MRCWLLMTKWSCVLRTSCPGCAAEMTGGGVSALSGRGPVPHQLKTNLPHPYTTRSWISVTWKRKKVLCVSILVQSYFILLFNKTPFNQKEYEASTEPPAAASTYLHRFIHSQQISRLLVIEIKQMFRPIPYIIYCIVYSNKRLNNINSKHL